MAHASSTRPVDTSYRNSSFADEFWILQRSTLRAGLVEGSVMELNFLAVVVAAVAAFILSGVWYGVFGSQLALLHPAYADSGSLSAKVVIVELARNLVLALVLAWLVDQIGVDDWAQAALIGFLLWIGIAVVLLIGSVYHEKVPAKLAAIHAGDWLLKLVVIAIIVGVWQ